MVVPEHTAFSDMLIDVEANDYVVDLLLIEPIEEAEPIRLSHDHIKLTACAPSGTKNDVHVITWISLFQSFTPYLVYDTLEKKAYQDYYGEAKPVTGKFGGYVGSEHFTKEVSNW